MNEDQDRTRMDNGPHNLALLRHIALNVIQKKPSKGSLRGKLMRAGWDERHLAQLLPRFEVRLPCARAGIEGTCAGASSVRLAQMPLYRVAKDAFTTRHYRRRSLTAQSR
jgi:hypothetical protein